MSPWDSLTPEQFAVMVVAYEEGYLVNVMDEWRARQHWAESGSARLVGAGLSDTDKERLIGHFAGVVADLLARMWIEVEEDEQPLSGDALWAALGDPKAWISDVDRGDRMIMLLRGTAWDELFANR
jgi:hypothetical protein